MNTAKFQKIPKSQAPKPTSYSGPLKARMRLYEEHLASIGPDHVGRLTPEANETARGIVLRVTRAGRRIDRPVKTWMDKGIVYFEPVS